MHSDTLQAPGFRLSPQQERLWGHRPTDSGYRAQCAARIAGDVDGDALRAALELVVDRHETLRTTFVRQTGMRLPSQVIHERLLPAWETLDLDGPLEEQLDEVLRREAAFDFDLESGPVLRGLLARVPGEELMLILTAPVVCADALSLTVVLSEVLDLARGGSSAELGQPLQYADYAEWRHELLSSDTDDARAGHSFWAEQETREPGPGPTLLFGAAGDGSAAFAPDRVVLPISSEESATVVAKGGAALLEAAWHVLVGRLSDESELTVAGTATGRSAEELQRAVGSFAGPVPIHTRFEAHTSFAEVIDQVLRARDDAETSFDYQRAEAGAEGVAAIAFSYVEVESPAGSEIVGLREGLQRTTLQLSLCQVDGVLTGKLVYEPSGYTREDVDRIARHYTTLVKEACSSPAARVDELPLLTAEERERLVLAFNDTSAPMPDGCIQYWVEEVAQRTPGRKAVVGGGVELTFGQLNERANRLAHLLRERGAARAGRVGLCMDRSAEMIAALLGIMKAGAAYVPLNFEHPSARLAHQLQEARATVVLTQEALADRLEGADVELICVDRDAESINSYPVENPERLSTSEDLAYVMYTSGSTGLPKGVAVTHGNLLNYTAHMVEKLGADSGAGLSFAAVSAISTDLGNTSVFPSLVSGGTLHLISPESSMDGELLQAYVQEHPIDVLKITPSHLGALLAGGGDHVLPGRWLVLGGEAASWELINRVEASSSCRILNHYGPTETTVGSCTFDVGTDVDLWQPATVPIGRPIANTRVYIVDPRFEPVPIGVAGELCIGGAGVAQGYLEQPELTAAVFVDSPFVSGERLYRTGDRARLLPDGSIEFLGRIDDQVKIRGFRVEPGEVELTLTRHPGVGQAAVVAVEDGHGDPRLVAYVAGEEAPSSNELRSFLLESLPEYMVPSTFVSVDTLPMTASGKIDRRALPDPAAVVQRETEYIAPRTPLEEELAAMWSEVLGVEQVGVKDDFFALGGHSLLATQAIARVRSGLGVDLPLHTIFVSPTVEQLAHEIVALQAPTEGEDVAALLDELESLTDEEVEQALAGEQRADQPE